MTIKAAGLLISIEVIDRAYSKVFDKGRVLLDGIFTPEQLRFIADTMDKIEEKTE